MARRIYAGADFFAMPSRFEPCGQGQMIALRYGTPPIVHRTGGLADTVIDETSQPGEGTGFVFDEPTPEALLGACERAFALRAAGGAAWDGLLDRGMAVDFDWVTGSAPSTWTRTGERSRSGSATRGTAAPGARAARSSACSQAPASEGAGRPTRSRGARDARPLRRVRARPAIGDRTWSGADPGRRTPARRRVPEVAAGRRVAADHPDRDAGSGRIGQVGQAAVPIAVVEQHGPGGGLVELGHGLGLGPDVPLDPGRVRGTDRGHGLVERGVRARTSPSTSRR